MGIHGRSSMNTIGTPTPAQIAERRASTGLTKSASARLVFPHYKNPCVAWRRYESGNISMSDQAWKMFCLETESTYLLNRKFQAPTAKQVAARRIACGLSKAAAGRIVSPRSTVPTVSWHSYEAGLARMPINKWRLFLLKTEDLFLLYSNFQTPTAKQVAARRIASGLSKTIAGRIISPEATNPCSVWCSYENGRNVMSKERWKLFWLKSEEIFRSLSPSEQAAFTKTEMHLRQG